MPPPWAIVSGKRLLMSDFAMEFAAAWSHMAGRFLKLECWQQYQEQESNKSLNAYMAGDVESAARLLREEAEEDGSLYDNIRSRKLDHARIRLVTLPLTPYLEYELLNYKVREEMGEKIVVVLLDSTVALPNDELFDFLLFDDNMAMVHDYGTDGFQVGGWLVEEPEAVRGLAATAVDLRRRSIPLAEFLGTATV